MRALNLSNQPPSLDVMRIALTILGGLCLLSGGVFFFQGINIIPGSFMTGQTRWAIYGALIAIAGIAVIIFANRRRV